MVEGTTQGSVTDIDGYFKQSVASNATLLFKYVGYKDLKEKVKQKGASVNLGIIRMTPDAVMLKDVVITSSVAVARKTPVALSMVDQPAEGKLQQIVCRFSPDAGLLPANDLTGDIVLLQYEPQGMAVDEAGVRPTSSTIPYRIAALTRCSLIAAGQEQAAQVLPVFQFGRTIALQVPRNR